MRSIALLLIALPLVACGAEARRPAEAPPQLAPFQRVHFAHGVGEPPLHDARYASCRWTSQQVPFQGCSGIERPPTAAQICNECATDSECTAGAAGRCIDVDSGGAAVRVCAYAGDACHPDVTCEGRCVLDEAQRAACVAPLHEEICRAP